MTDVHCEHCVYTCTVFCKYPDRYSFVVVYLSITYVALQMNHLDRGSQSQTYKQANLINYKANAQNPLECPTPTVKLQRIS